MKKFSIFFVFCSFRGIFLYFCCLADHEFMTSVAQRRGEDIRLTTVFQFETLAQFCHGEGEIPRRDIRLVRRTERLAQFLLVHPRHGPYAELSAGEGDDV